MHELLLIGCALIAALVSGTVGFGAGLVLLGLASFFIDIKEIMFITTIFLLAMSGSKIVLFWESIQWKYVGLILLGALPLTYLGAELMVISDAALLSKILGGFILLYILSSPFLSKLSFVLPNWGIVLGGSVYGFFSGLVATGMPVKVALLDHIGLRKEKFVGTLATSAVVGNILKLFVYSQLQFESQNNVPLILGLILMAPIGTWIGRHFLRKMSPEFFRTLVLVFLAIVGVKMVVFS